MAAIYSNSNRDSAIELVKAALAGGALSQIPTDKLNDVERVRAHSLYITRMIGSLEGRLDSLEVAPGSTPAPTPATPISSNLTPSAPKKTAAK